MLQAIRVVLSRHIHLPLLIWISWIGLGLLTVQTARADEGHPPPAESTPVSFPLEEPASVDDHASDESPHVEPTSPQAPHTSMEDASAHGDEATHDGLESPDGDDGEAHPADDEARHTGDEPDLQADGRGTHTEGEEERHVEDEAQPHPDGETDHHVTDDAAHEEDEAPHGEDAASDGHGHETEVVSSTVKRVTLAGFAGVNGLAVAVAAGLRRRHAPKLPKHLRKA